MSPLRSALALIVALVPATTVAHAGKPDGFEDDGTNEHATPPVVVQFEQ